MIEAISPIGPSAALQPEALRPSPDAVSLKQPTSAEAADFVRALGASPPLEVSAAPLAGDGDLSARFAAQADLLSTHLQALGPTSSGGAAQPSAAGHPLADAKAQMGDAVAQIERAYMFAIETTMASRGSTETTKIFNTLLKGQ